MVERESQDNRSFVAKGTEFLRDARAEWTKVSKPTRQETLQTTLVAIMLVIFIAASLGLMDVIFFHLTKTFIG